jgi:hypothetical protein
MDLQYGESCACLGLSAVSGYTVGGADRGDGLLDGGRSPVEVGEVARVLGEGLRRRRDRRATGVIAPGGELIPLREYGRRVFSGTERSSRPRVPSDRTVSGLAGT